MQRSDARPRAPVVIRIRTVPPLAGLAWIRAGFRLFARRPGGFMLLSGVSFIAVFLLLLAMPPVLEPLWLLLIPLGSLGFMVATEAVLNDLPALPGAFIAPLRTGAPQRRALLLIGLLYVLTALAAYAIGNWIDDGEAVRWMVAVATPAQGGTPTLPPPLSTAGTVSLLLQTSWLVFVSVPLWHAPALVHWGRQRAPQAMFSSIVAVWRTRGAFILYHLGWWVVSVLAMAAIAILTALVGTPLLAVMLFMAAMWPLSTVFYVTFWYGFADTFEIRPAPAEAVGEAADARAEPPGQA
jgi:hypothetical protein